MSWIDDEEDKYFEGESPPVDPNPENKDYSQAKIQTQGPAPVYLDWDKSRQIGNAYADLDAETGKVKLRIDLNNVIDTDGIFEAFSEQTFSLASRPRNIPKAGVDGMIYPEPSQDLSEALDNVVNFGIHKAGTVEEIDASMSRHPAGKKRVNPNG